MHDEITYDHWNASKFAILLEYEKNTMYFFSCNTIIFHEFLLVYLFVFQNYEVYLPIPRSFLKTDATS